MVLTTSVEVNFEQQGDFHARIYLSWFKQVADRGFGICGIDGDLSSRSRRRR
jgi:hypothetical protein